jgi:peptide/nickel transport system substrate-binding protein
VDRGIALAAAVAASLLAVSGAGGASVQSPKRGGTVYSIRPEPTCLNPLSCIPDPVVLQVLEGAFEVGPDLVFRPNLVSGVTIDSKRPFALTYHIRPEARWSDGVPVTASDFDFTQKTLATHPTTPGVDFRELHGKIRRARVVNAKTFRIELREPVARWRELYPVVFPRHALLGEDITRVWVDRIDNPKTGRPIGSGPFLIGRWQRGVELVQVRNPRYWGNHVAYLDRYVSRFVRAIPSPEVLERVRRGETDLAPFLTPDDASQIRGLPGWRIVSWPGPAMEHLLLRVGPGGHPALEQKRVRQALAFGIDRVAIARAIQADVDPSSRRPLDSTMFLPTESSYRGAWAGYRYDPERAQRLLREAGCRRGTDSIYSCAGERMSLRFVTTAGNPVRERTLQLMQAQLRRAGVEVVLTFASNPIVFGQILPRGQFDAALFAWVTNGGGVAWPDVWCGHQQNWGGYCDRLVQRDLKQTDLIVEQQQRARVLNAADRKLARAVPVLPIVQPVIQVAIRDTIRGMTPGGSQFHVFQTTEDWWLAESR